MQSGFEQNRRYFPRVKVRAHATLSAGDGKQWPVHILDLSFNGALAALIHEHDLAAGENVTLRIEPEESREAPIRMQGRLCHQRGHFLGIECRATGIDNKTHLRELLKRNQRQQSLAERSYSSLLADYDRDSD
ncbi:PilZ domain-containing protein [Proteobacteria bacterium 005FR1]|nr:PilZ domain-containing protein [Proteobacteria bacterium 005FR1]